MRSLIEKINKCERCQISNQTKNKVIGKGAKDNVKILFIGLNPGKDENETGIPFVGKSGKLLDKWINFLGVSPKRCSVVNLIKCFTPNQSGLNGDEADNCFPYLERQIQLLNPEHIVVLGDIVYKKLTNQSLSITQAEGKFFPSVFKNKDVFVMRHPSYFVRKGSVGWEDSLNQLKDLLNQQVVTEVQEYTPLHCHSEYSLTDGAGRLEDLVEHAKNVGFKAMALTDHGTISGWYEFQQLCDKYSIKGILGIEFYVAKHYDDRVRNFYHLVTLAKDQVGINNIFKLNTIANSPNNFYYNPRITLDDVIKHKEGLVISTACVSGILSKRILDGQVDDAFELAKKLKKEFKDDIYIELQGHYFPEQLRVNAVLSQIIDEYNIKPIVTTDAHYKSPRQHELHTAIKSISYGTKYGESGFSGNPTYCLLDSNKLKFEFLESNITKKQLEESMKNSMELADKCNGRMEKYGTIVPNFPIPEEFDETQI